MGSIYLGGTKINKIYFGSTAIKKVYSGSTLIWSSGNGTMTYNGVITLSSTPDGETPVLFGIKSGIGYAYTNGSTKYVLKYNMSNGALISYKAFTYTSGYNAFTGVLSTDGSNIFISTGYRKKKDDEYKYYNKYSWINASTLNEVSANVSDSSGGALYEMSRPSINCNTGCIYSVYDADNCFVYDANAMQKYGCSTPSMNLAAYMTGRIYTNKNSLMLCYANNCSSIKFYKWNGGTSMTHMKDISLSSLSNYAYTGSASGTFLADNGRFAITDASGWAGWNLGDYDSGTFIKNLASSNDNDHYPFFPDGFMIDAYGWYAYGTQTLHICNTDGTALYDITYPTTISGSNYGVYEAGTNVLYRQETGNTVYIYSF